MEPKRIEVSELLRACHEKSDIGTHWHTGIFSPFEATTPSIITDTGCFVVETLWISEMSLPNVATRSFCFVEDWIDRKRLLIGKNEDSISMFFHIIQKAGAPL